ncbi:hypothetical protein V3481_005391 [Fusarium oxysporum f. sp. vasinfectum]
MSGMSICFLRCRVSSFRTTIHPKTPSTWVQQLKRGCYLHAKSPDAPQVGTGTQLPAPEFHSIISTKWLIEQVLVQGRVTRRELFVSKKFLADQPYQIRVRACFVY